MKQVMVAEMVAIDAIRSILGNRHDWLDSEELANLTDYPCSEIDLEWLIKVLSGRCHKLSCTDYQGPQLYAVEIGLLDFDTLVGIVNAYTEMFDLYPSETLPVRQALARGCIEAELSQPRIDGILEEPIREAANTLSGGISQTTCTEEDLLAEINSVDRGGRDGVAELIRSFRPDEVEILYCSPPAPDTPRAPEVTIHNVDRIDELIHRVGQIQESMDTFPTPPTTQGQHPPEAESGGGMLVPRGIDVMEVFRNSHVSVLPYFRGTFDLGPYERRPGAPLRESPWRARMRGADYGSGRPERGIEGQPNTRLEGRPSFRIGVDFSSMEMSALSMAAYGPRETPEAHPRTPETPDRDSDSNE